MNCRPASPPHARRQFGRAVHAQRRVSGKANGVESKQLTIGIGVGEVIITGTGPSGRLVAPDVRPGDMVLLTGRPAGIQAARFRGLTRPAARSGAATCF